MTKLFNQYAHFGIKELGKSAMGVLDGGMAALPGGLQIPKASKLDKALAFGTLASVPIGIGSMVMPSGDTRAINKMREEDKLREAKGLPQLAATGDLLKQKAQQMAQTMSNGGTRVTNINPNQVPAPPLPPRSMM
jgi:hypothetical protein